MRYVYIDESGDLGRSESSSRFVVIAAVVTEEPRRLEKLVRKVWRTKQHTHKHGELHAIHATRSTERKLLSLLSATTTEYAYVVIDKVRIPDNLYEAYYKYLGQVVDHFLGERIIVVDARDTVRKRIKTLQSLRLEECFRGVEFEDSRFVRPLQVADFVAWSIFQSVEYGRTEFIDLLGNSLSKVHCD